MVGEATFAQMRKRDRHNLVSGSGPATEGGGDRTGPQTAWGETERRTRTIAAAHSEEVQTFADALAEILSSEEDPTARSPVRSVEISRTTTAARILTSEYQHFRGAEPDAIHFRSPDLDPLRQTLSSIFARWHR